MESLRYHSFKNVAQKTVALSSILCESSCFILVLVPGAGRLLFCDVRSCSSSNCVPYRLSVFLFQKNGTWLPRKGLKHIENSVQMTML